MVEQEKTTSQQLLKKATDEGKVSPPFLKLKGTKRKHTVKFISDRVIKGAEYGTGKEIEQVEYTFEEDEIKKKYCVRIRDENGELYYFVQRMAEYQKGEILTLEYKPIKGTFKGFIDVNRPGEETETSPTSTDVKEEDIPVIEEDKEINVDEIPF